VIICQLLTTMYTRESKLLWHLLVYITVLAPHSTCCCVIISQCPSCRELTTLLVARLDEGMELKVTDPKEQHRDVDEEEAKDKERRERVDYGG